MLFGNRRDAGVQLGEELRRRSTGPAVVLAIPRGGVVVGYEVASALSAQLDVVMARKIGAPYNPELAIGAVAPDGQVFLDHRLLRSLGVEGDYVREEAERQRLELERRMKAYRGGRRPPDLTGKNVIITDDGIATGFTVLAALAWARRQGPSQLIVAVPVAPPQRLAELKASADEVVCLCSEEPFYAVGQFYADFDQLDDQDAVDLLNAAWNNQPRVEGG